MIQLFTSLFFKLIPLYMNIVLGFIAGKVLQIPRDILVRLMFYLINPIIMFNGILHTRIDAGVLSLPVIVLAISCTLCLGVYRLSRTLWTDSTRNLAAFTAGSGNTGYFGLPLAIMFLDNQGEGVYMLGMVGFALYENTLGFYICAKNSHSAYECVEKLAKLPTIYAFISALFLNYMQVPIPEVFADFMCHIKGTYIVLGMMIIGVGLASLTHFKLDFKFLGITFFAKFIVWPALALLIIFVDLHLFGFFSSDIYHALLLLSIVPLAVNSVVLATVLKAQPEKAAIAVMLSTLLALVYVPLMVIYFMPEATAVFGEKSCITITYQYTKDLL